MAPNGLEIRTTCAANGKIIVIDLVGLPLLLLLLLLARDEAQEYKYVEIILPFIEREISVCLASSYATG